MEYNDIKLLSLFIFAKQKRGNGCHFNYSNHKLSKQIGFSTTKWARHIKIFIEKGWCRTDISKSGKVNLIFNPLNKVMPQGFRKFRPDPKRLTVRDIKDQLILHALSREANKQKFIVQIKSDLKQATDHIILKKAKRSAKKHGIASNNNEAEKIDDRFIISVYSLAKVFETSISTASRFMNKLADDGLIDIISNVTKIRDGVSSGFFRSLNLPACYYYDQGQIFKRELNEYRL
jgi:DNA-binding MarR family transcriptional regulator